MQIDPQWAWEPFRPSMENPWDRKKAAHLFRRAAFGTGHGRLQKAVEEGCDKTVASLLEPEEKNRAEFDALVDRMAADVAAANDEAQMRAWWIYRILRSPFPLQEKMTLFWHNHFATSQAKVANVGYMIGQNLLLRRLALGSFRKMLHEVSKDPAMMVWLDTDQNKKGQPNENYARELMELFSLGLGNYTETDIREAARAFTGWEIKNGKFFFNRSQHDGGEKIVFGKKGKFRGEDIVDLCLEKPSCPYFVAGKLYRFFISETEPPDKALLAPLAESLKKSDYDIGRLAATMLRSNLFFSDHAYRKRIKSPTDFAVGTVTTLEGTVSPLAIADALNNLGQRLFYPPSVKGWDGGKAWLNATTLLLRNNLALDLTSTEDLRFGRRCDPAVLVRRCLGNKAGDDQAVADFYGNLFYQSDWPEAARKSIADYLAKAKNNPYPVYWSEQDKQNHRLRAACHLALTLPEAQLE